MGLAHVVLFACFRYLNLNVMRNIILFFVTGIIATIGLFAALGMKTPWVGFAIAFGGWSRVVLKISFFNTIEARVCRKSISLTIHFLAKNLLTKRKKH